MTQVDKAFAAIRFQIISYLVNYLFLSIPSLARVQYVNLKLLMPMPMIILCKRMFISGVFVMPAPLDKKHIDSHWPNLNMLA